MKKSAWVFAAITGLCVCCYAFTGKPKDPGWKNLKILPQNITERQLDSVMEHFNVSLKADCQFCHVKVQGTDEWDWASDKNKHKGVARQMMEMTNKLNNEYFPYGGKAEDMATDLTVTCYTCHQGRKHPLVSPPANAGGSIPASPPGQLKPAMFDSLRKQ